MEAKKLSRTVQKRLNKKLRLQSGAASETNSLESLPHIPPTATMLTEQPKHTEKVSTNESKVKNTPTLMTISKRQRKNVPEKKVVCINSNYGSNEPNSVGGLIQAELVELRKQSKNIKTASDLTESQAHVVKRQITRLQAPENERVFKRPKHYDQTLGEATKELMRMMEKQKTKRHLGKQ